MTTAPKRPTQRTAQPYRMVESANDRQIVRLVHDYRILSAAQIQRLLQRSKPTVARLLRRLYDHHYLERVALPVATAGQPPLFYILGKRGYALLRQQGVSQFRAQPARRLFSLYLEHTQALNDFRLRVSQAAATTDYTIENWITENEIKADYDRVQVDAKTNRAVLPDSTFKVVAPGKPASHFFVELDRGTMSLSAFRAKVRTYIAYKRSGGYARRYQTQSLRVLTVVAGVGPGRVRNLINDVAAVNGVGRKFWFAHLQDCEAHNPLADPIWQIAGRAGRYTLV